MAPLRLPYGGRAETVRWLFDPRVFLSICVQNAYNYSFLIELALQNKIQHKTETLAGAVAVRLPHGDCSIPVPFYGQPCDSRAGPYDYLKSLWSSCDFLFQNDQLKHCVLRMIAVRPACGARTRIMRCSYDVSMGYGLKPVSHLSCDRLIVCFCRE